MENEIENRIQRLENQIKTLEQWKVEKEKQQIKFPLDAQSIEILNKDFMRIYGSLEYTAGAGGNSFVEYLGRQENTIFSVTPPSLVTYSVNVSTNYITTNQTSGNLKFFDNIEVVVYSDDTVPSPLMSGITYYVINSDGYKFQLSTTLAGAAIDITNTGTGSQFIAYA